MTLSESGNAPSIPENDDLNLRAETMRQCRAELCDLDGEVKAIKSLPTEVVDFLNTNVPGNQKDAAVALAQTMLADNPHIFDLPAEMLPVVLRPCLQFAEAQNHRADEADEDRKIVENKATLKQGNTIIEGLTSEVQLEEISRTDPALKNLKGQALIAALNQHDLVKSSPHLQDYLRRIEDQLNALQSLAATPQETAVLETIIGQSAINFGADNTADIFADLMARTDQSSEILEATKAKVHELFNIPTIQTAGDLQTVLNNGYGLDSEGGKIPISADQKLRVFPNTYLYEAPSGGRIFEITVPGERKFKVRFDRNSTEHDLYDSSLTVQMMGLMAQMNLAAPIWQRGWTLQTGGVIDLHYDDVIKAKRVYSLMGGGTSGFDGRLIGAGDQQQLSHSLQAFPRKGDAAAGDNNSGQALADYQELTIVNEDGTINWSQFEKAAAYLQDVSARGGQPNFNDLKAHLTGGSEDEMDHL